MFIMPPPHRKGAISVAFVRPFIRLSVCPSVAYIANNSRTQRPSVTKSGRKVPHLRYDWHTGFKIEKSKVATRPINADTHWLAVWLSGNALASINVVALCQTRLVLGWVTVCGRVNHFGM